MPMHVRRVVGGFKLLISVLTDGAETGTVQAATLVTAFVAIVLLQWLWSRWV